MGKREGLDFGALSRGEEWRFIFFDELNTGIDGGVVFSRGSCGSVSWE